VWPGGESSEKADKLTKGGGFLLRRSGADMTWPVHTAEKKDIQKNNILFSPRATCLIKLDLPINV